MERLLLKSRFSVLAAIASVMLLAGALTPWIAAPLGPSHKLLEIELAGLSEGVFGLMLIAAVLCYLVFRALRLPRLALGAALLLLTLMASFFFLFGLSDHPWLMSYLAESDQRTNLELLFERDYWPNMNPEPSMILIPDFEHLGDRLTLFWHITAFGFSVALAGACILLLDSALKLPLEAALSIVFAVAIALAVFARSSPMAAELEHRRGDAYLSQGRYSAAIESYRSALELDPVLRHSRAFALKSSYAFMKIEGTESPLARLALANTRAVPDSEIPANIKSSYTSYRYLSEADGASHGQALEQAILDQTERQATNLLVLLGLSVSAESHSSSAAALRKAHERMPGRPDTLVLLAHSQIGTGLWDEAISHLALALDRVQNPGIRADILCTIGDAYRQKGDPLSARKAYTECAEIDEFRNYRATRHLGGT